MKGSPCQLAARLLAAAFGAGIALLAWELWLRDRDAVARERTEEVGREIADLGADVAVRILGDRMLDVGAVVLCAAPFAVPEAAVEWQLLGDGRVVQRRSAPLPAVPGRVPVAAAAVSLPVDRLSALRPEARAALLDLLSTLWRDRPVEPARLVLQDIVGDAGDCAALLAWLR